VADLFERSACNAESAGSSLDRDGSPCRDLEQVLSAQLLCNTSATAPSRLVKFGALHVWGRRTVLKAVVLHCVDVVP